MSNNVYIGWDGREMDAYEVAKHSILKRTESATCHALSVTSLCGILTRPVYRQGNRMWCPISKAPMATEFAVSRFAVPFLQRGWALFVDSDIVCLSDIKELFDLADPKYAVMCVKHKQKEGPATKMDGQAQTFYARKNWSSVVLWNCDHTAHDRFTLQSLNSWPGRDLHAFKWLQDSEIGELPPNWNYLVDVNLRPDPIKLAHFTLGGPWFKDWKGGSCDDIWLAERKAMA